MTHYNIMRTIGLFFIMALWAGLQAQNIQVRIEKTTGNCLLESNCETNTVCYDLILEIDDPGWELRSYNVWVNYPSPPLMTYNSDNACATQNGGDTNNDAEGQYRVGGINGAFLLEAGTPNVFHSICFEYDDPALLANKFVRSGGTSMVFGFPFESTITLLNTQTGETSGFLLEDKDSIAVVIDDNQPIAIDLGWSGISGWLQPADPTIETIMAPVVDQLEVMYNLTDGIYSPAHNINTINNWNYKSGYVVKLNDASDISFCGASADNTVINLMPGWNIIPVLSNMAVPVESVFDELGEKLIIAKEIAGYRVYYPAFSINSLSSLIPGKAYYIKVTESCTIEFPATAPSQILANQQYYFEDFSPWNVENKTPESHTFIFSEQASHAFDGGDIVGAFGPDGNCYGMMEVQQTGVSFAIPAFINDNTTEIKDGFDDGDAILFKVFRISTGEEFTLEIAINGASPSGKFFEPNGISIIDNITIGTTGTGVFHYSSGEGIATYPNPVIDELNLELKSDVAFDGKLLFTDGRGRLIFSEDYSHNGGISKRVFDLASYQAGVYYLRISAENYLVIRKIIIK
jgi:hypothetical protein